MNVIAGARTPRSPRRALRQGFKLAAPVLAMLVMLVSTGASLVLPDSLPFVRYLAVLPVALASYRHGGRGSGLSYTLFFASAFLWQAFWTPGSGDLVSALAMAIVLLACVFVFNGVGVSFGSREILIDAAQERAALLERSTDLNRLVSFIREEAQGDVEAESAALIVFNAWEGRWELIGDAGRVVVAPPVPGAPLSLPAWLAGQSSREVIRDLHADVRFADTGRVRSLVARPLRDGAGKLLGVLVLAHTLPGRFTPADLARLDRLATSAETALAHAGAYARTGRAFERVAGQLAAIERTARELNATLDPREIARHTLHCSLALTGATRGVLRVDAAGLEPVQIAAGDESETLEQVGLVTPITLGDRSLGAIIVATGNGDATATQDRQALATLAEHAAGALESARLYAQVRNEREKSNQIIRNMADGLLTLDASRLITSANPAAERLLGQPAADMLGQRLCGVLRCDSPDCGDECQTLEALARGEAVPEGAWRTRAGDQPGAILRLNAAQLPPPEGGAVVLLRDVTRQEELTRFQREIVATFSHELRSPLANIDAAVQLLLALQPGAASPDQRQFLELVQAQTRKLAGLAERTLDVSRLDEGKWRLEPRPLAAARITEDALARWQGAAPARHFSLAVEGAAPWAWADEVAVTTVLDNLLDNAVKYTPQGGEIVVRVSEGPAGCLTVAVEDQGPGVAPDQAELLFERFRRGAGRDSRRVDGYGLGLYVARRLVEAMGGHIWAESRPEGGSRFSFTLPRVPEIADEDPDC